MKNSSISTKQDSRRLPFASKATVAVIALAGLALLLGACDKGSEPGDGGGDDLRAQLIAEGQPIFSQCEACHGHGGVGESGPPLKHSDFVIAERMRPVRILLMGLPNAIDTATTIVVNGVPMEGNSMPALGAGMTDREVAAIVTYVRAVLNDSTSVNCTAEENQDGQLVSDCDIIVSPEGATTMVTPDEVKALRDSLTTAGLIE